MNVAVDTNAYDRLLAEAKDKRSSAKKGGAIKSLRSGASDVHKFNPLLLEVEPDFNVRKHVPQEEEDSLFEHVKAGLPIPNLVIRTEGDRIIVVDGHRRLRAVIRAIKAGVSIDTVGCVTEAAGFDHQTRQMAIIGLYNNGLKMADEDVAEQIVKGINWGWSAAKIEKWTRKTKSQQDRLVKLLEAPADVREAIRNGRDGVGITANFWTQTLAESGSEAEAVAKVEAAVEVAKQMGSKKATAKHVAKAGIDTKLSTTQKLRVVSKLFTQLAAEGSIDRSGEHVKIAAFELTHDQYAEFAKAIGLAQ